MTSLNRSALAALLCFMLVACGARHEQGATAVAARPAGRAHNVAATAEQPPARSSDPLARSDAPADGESVTDSSFSFSPLAKAVAATAAPVPSGLPAKWVENTNYSALVPVQPTESPAGKVEVLEVFWYGCPHCFHLDPFLENWRSKGKPAFVDFRRMHVLWPGNEVVRAHARLFFTMEALGKLPALHAEVFREIHVNRNLLADPTDPAHTEQLQKAFLTSHGVSAADFDRTYKSFSVESKLQHAEQFTMRYKVAGVPLLVVAGRYTTDVSQAGSETDLLTLIGDLATAERRR